MFRITETVKHLLIINVIVFIASQTPMFQTQAYDLLALHFPANEKFQIWQVFTHMFMHGNVQHILFNMFALWMFGTQVEQMFGRNKFIFFYIASGLGAAFVQLIAYYVSYNGAVEAITAAGMSQDALQMLLNEGKYNTTILQNLNPESLETAFQAYNTTMVGASGAIMGILVAYGMLFPNAELMMIFFPIPIKAKYFIPAIIGLDLFSGITGTSIFSPSNTAYFAHVGGALAGFIMMWYWKKNQFNRNRWDR
ncbi:rhomboid family intramembrane serine protease [Spongiivirga sp. MCCC 1A20706]|uniref:rhomboid family intramembrane serine protease n=1 Tax=Spongiivirga sp. MCCC 1A20706 TaxID=3160963 RepID=UPI003977A006